MFQDTDPLKLYMYKNTNNIKYTAKRVHIITMTYNMDCQTHIWAITLITLGIKFIPVYKTWFFLVFKVLGSTPYLSAISDFNTGLLCIFELLEKDKTKLINIDRFVIMNKIEYKNVFWALSCTTWEAICTTPMLIS